MRARGVENRRKCFASKISWVNLKLLPKMNRMSTNVFHLYGWNVFLRFISNGAFPVMVTCKHYHMEDFAKTDLKHVRLLISPCQNDKNTMNLTVKNLSTG